MGKINDAEIHLTWVIEHTNAIFNWNPFFLNSEGSAFEASINYVDHADKWFCSQYMKHVEVTVFCTVYAKVSQNNWVFLVGSMNITTLGDILIFVDQNSVVLENKSGFGVKSKYFKSKALIFLLLGEIS